MTVLTKSNGVSVNNDHLKDDQSVLTEDKDQPKELVYERKFIFVMMVLAFYFHPSAVYGFYLAFSAKKATILFAFLYGYAGIIGVNAGVHRLWSHRAFKAKFPLRVFLMLCHTSTYQRSLYYWARDHRCHHKYTDTDADPHTTSRGYFFAHLGWLLVNKHPLLKQKGRGLDLTDLEQDSVVMFQKKYYYFLMPIFCFIIPTIIPAYFWGEGISIAYHIAVLRYAYTSHITFLINSVVHAIGMKPYDKNNSSTDNSLFAIIMLGEGFHNRHHAFPRDYRTSEFGGYGWNITTGFIEICAWLGLAYDLKVTSPEMMAKRAARTGDGSYKHHGTVTLATTDGEIYEEDFFNEEEDKRLFQDLNKSE